MLFVRTLLLSCILALSVAAAEPEPLTDTNSAIFLAAENGEWLNTGCLAKGFPGFERKTDSDLLFERIDTEGVYTLHVIFRRRTQREFSPQYTVSDLTDEDGQELIGQFRRHFDHIKIVYKEKQFFMYRLGTESDWQRKNRISGYSIGRGGNAKRPRGTGGTGRIAKKTGRTGTRAASG